MGQRFHSAGSCFINTNYRLFQSLSRDSARLAREDALEMLENVKYAPLSRFFELHDS
jgi:hypothetical protein